MAVHLEENFSLQSFNTFGIPARAKYFAQVETEQELKELLLNHQKISKQNPLVSPPLFLGMGSNVLFTKDYEGLVIQLNLKGIEEVILDEHQVKITAMAGENWHEFVLYCLSKDFGGLENLSLIPGNVGTSPMQNIGAYGVEIKDVFHSLRALNLETLEIEEFSKEACEFGYRESYFKRKGKNRFAILKVSFLLTRKDHITRTNYGAIEQELAAKNISSPTIKEVSDAVITIRQSKLPDPKLLGNAGSFFKNPTVSHEDFKMLQKKFPKIHNYPMETGVKIPAGHLIEECGWKGKQIGNVASHSQQSLVLVNQTGKASGKEIFEFSEKIIQSVQERYGITLEREVNIV